MNRVIIYTLQLDGNAWCATNENFVDLQVSDNCYAYGDTPEQALKMLILIEKEQEHCQH